MPTATLLNLILLSFGDRDLYSALFRLHLLHHAVVEPNFELGILEEVARHGYRLGPSLYPIVHSLEKKSYFALKRKAREIRQSPRR